MTAEQGTAAQTAPPPTDTNKGTEATSGTSTAEPATFDADYVKKLREENAKYRTAAKANEAAATRLAEIEESQKSETQRLTDRTTAAEKAAAQAAAEALRWRIAAKHGVSDELADLYLTGSDEETLTRQAAGLAALRPPSEGIRPDPSQGARTGGGVTGDPAQQFAQFVKSRLT